MTNGRLTYFKDSRKRNFPLLVIYTVGSWLAKYVLYLLVDKPKKYAMYRCCRRSVIVDNCLISQSRRSRQQVVVVESRLTICWMSQALAAACKTVNPALLVHSLHAYFLRAGNDQSMYMYQLLTFYTAMTKKAHMECSLSLIDEVGLCL